MKKMIITHHHQSYGVIVSWPHLTKPNASNSSAKTFLICAVSPEQLKRWRLKVSVVYHEKSAIHADPSRALEVIHGCAVPQMRGR